MLKNIPLDKAYFLINHGPVVFLTSAFEDKHNVMTLAWFMPVNYDPPLVAIAVGEESFTCQLIKKQKEFAINIPTKELLPAILYCGQASGKEENKFKKAKLSCVKAQKIKPPLIAQCIGFLECKVDKILNDFGDVTVFVGKIVACCVQDNLFDECLSTEKAKTVHHLGEENFAVIGERLKNIDEHK